MKHLCTIQCPNWMVQLHSGPPLKDRLLHVSETWSTDNCFPDVTMKGNWVKGHNHPALKQGLQCNTLCWWGSDSESSSRNNRKPHFTAVGAGKSFIIFNLNITLRMKWNQKQFLELKFRPHIQNWFICPGVFSRMNDTLKK